MPGIAGIISKKPIQINEPTLDTMIGAMYYEDFYTSGKYLNEQMGVYVGWTVHKESFADCLPIYNKEKDVILICYGENHANSDVLQIVKSKDHDVTTLNASYLIHLYEDDTQEFLKKLNGWFCGLLIDLRKKKSFLFNDRYGMQRIYFHEDKDTAYFASEAKCILKAKPELRKITAQGLADLLYCQCVLDNQSLFENIDLLPGGSCWEIQHKEIVNKHRYFDPTEFEKLPPLDGDVFYTRLQETLRRILPKYFIANGRIAFSLTGGLDTRMILANIPKPLTNIECYSHGGAYRDCYDVKIARQIANLCGLAHHTLKIDDKFIADFPALAKKTIFITDGYMDLNGTPSLYLHGKAREISNIRFTGNFGDQVLVGRINLLPSQRKSQIVTGDLHTYIDQSAERFRQTSVGHPLTFFLFKQAPWFDYTRYSLEQSQLVQRSPFMDLELISLLYQSPKGMLASQDIRMRLIRDGNSELVKIPTDRGYLGSNIIFAAKALHSYRDFLFKLEYYFSYGMPHWLAKLNNAISFTHLEYLFLEVNKYYNLRRWFRYELAEYVKSILLDTRTLNRPFINRSFVENMVAAHTSGRGNYTNQINRLLSIELSFRCLIEDI
ncbi:MAG: asparagine synthase-related protein [Desulfobacterales bacterium]